MEKSLFTGGNLGSAQNDRNYNSIAPSDSQKPSVIKNKNNFFNRVPAIVKLVSKIKAYFIVKGVKSALKEVDLFEKGVKKPKSLDQLLNEL